MGVGLPDGIGAPQPLLRRNGVEAIGPGELAVFIRFTHQALFAVEVVGGFYIAALPDGF